MNQILYSNLSLSNISEVLALMSVFWKDSNRYGLKRLFLKMYQLIQNKNEPK